MDAEFQSVAAMVFLREKYTCNELKQDEEEIIT